MSGRLVLVHHHRRKRHHMRGRGFMDFIKKAGSFLKKTGLVSTIGNALGAAGVPYASQIGSLAGKAGYGRRRRYRRVRHHGGALKLAGQGLGPAGARHHMHRRHHMLHGLRMAY